MKIPSYYPYRSAEAKETYLSFYDRRAQRWPVVSESRMVSTSHGQTFVRIGGPDGGQPLVLLPGMGTTSLLWTPVIEAFSTRYRTYAPDSIADVGRSICSRPIANSGGLVCWLDELFTALDLGDKINLLGMSYGGWLTALYALRFPSRLRKIVLVAPGATVLRTGLEFQIRGALVLTRRRYFTRKFVHWLFADLARKNPSRIETSVDRMLLTFRCLQPRHVIAPTVFKDHELQSLRMPALFLVGEHEKIYSPAKAVRRLNRVAPRIRAEVIRGAGHDLIMAQPEMAEKTILEFLDERG
jgi:pimeloyl-ACP methyl ester carboxylesterase